MARILVIENNQPFRELVSAYLKYTGYDVLTAANGLEGVEVFRSCPDLIDLVLTDLRMPVMSGSEAVQEIWHTRSDAKVMFMTGSPQDVRLEQIPMIEKPFPLKELGRSISRLLANVRVRS